jgi:hypothetical protein
METEAGSRRTPPAPSENPTAPEPRDDPARWLVIVRRDRAELQAWLRRSFDASPLVRVILDRRQAERRRASARVPRELRREERRQVLRAADPDATGQYRLLRDGGDCRVLEATGRIPTRCPECQSDLEFELPRFADPPVRLRATVVHTPQPLGGVQHHIATEAFTASGRSLLACLIMARRRRAGPAGAVPRPG